jgi:hypothetical protein
MSRTALMRRLRADDLLDVHRGFGAEFARKL